MELKDYIRGLKIEYARATRCWQSNNYKSCLQICDKLTKELSKCLSEQDGLKQLDEIVQLKHLSWFLKLRCLSDDYYINESLLLNENDIEDEDQVRTFTGTKQSGPNSTARGFTREASDGIGRKIIPSSGKMETRHRTGILTGRMSSVASRGSSRGASSYRPLTTSLTATQTAFSRSTRPLLKYSTSALLSKIVFEYLYNAQAVTNKCPDYRQCLEYLNLVQITTRKQALIEGQQQQANNKGANTDDSNAILIFSNSDESDDRKSLGVFWLISFGTCYYNLRMNKQAEEYFLQAIEINPKYLDSYTWLVKIYLRTNQPIKVLRACENGLAHSKNAILYNWMARVQSMMGDIFTANLNLRDSLKYYPTNVEALANVGHFAFYGDKLEHSLKCFERIQQLSSNHQSLSLNNEFGISGSSAQLLNNLALCNFYCGFYHKVVQLFLKSFLNSPNKEVTSDIWYNISFVPMSFGYKNLALDCLRLALKNNSQNEEAINNLGVLKYGNLIADGLHLDNRHELWASHQQQKASDQEPGQLKNMDDHNQYQEKFDEAESYFGPPTRDLAYPSSDGLETLTLSSQPEMLYNMAVLKKERGHLLASVKYCKLYLEHDRNNYHIRNLLKEIRQLVTNDN